MQTKLSSHIPGLEERDEQHVSLRLSCSYERCFSSFKLKHKCFMNTFQMCVRFNLR